MRATFGKILILVSLVACGKGAPAPESAPIDASPVAAFAPLVGTWSGSMYISSIGTASGMVSLDPSGSGQFFVTTAAGQRSGQLQILSLTDTHVRGQAEGYERTLRVNLEGNRMRLDVPQLGQVVLTRTPAQAP